MEIKVGQKWVAYKLPNIRDIVTGRDNFSIFNIGDIITITGIMKDVNYPYNTKIIPLSKDEILENFVTLAEWRNNQINSILDGD